MKDVQATAGQTNGQQDQPPAQSSLTSAPSSADHEEVAASDPQQEPRPYRCMTIALRDWYESLDAKQKEALDRQE